ncbi:hypothetical protein C491_04625 [Natronococcus amylolyticus DSM 10524]|uniref:DUF7511 domain-containing protein n=1 Tax=Natronococcus amylolyticus DSM 10524 TaxID=1227497 RepID=L9XIR8_9EURY|nr:hypothetical protein [Natronococcus amylolyticus]ELY60553.1 hypothetical protein C491_04625 [Natronococcus amylolyticus DSM 10524]
MTEYDTDADPFADARTETDGDVSPCYQAYIERRDHRPDSCTVYCALDGESIEDTWIRAKGDAFVSREDAR